MPKKLEGEQKFSPCQGGGAGDTGWLCGGHALQEGYLERAACTASGCRMEQGFDEGNLEGGRPVRRLPPPPGGRPMVACTGVVTAGRGGLWKDVTRRPMWSELRWDNWQGSNPGASSRCSQSLEKEEDGQRSREREAGAAP